MRTTNSIIMEKQTIFNSSFLLGSQSSIVLCIVILSMTFSTKAFSQILTFTFDASGNQTKRVCVNCPILNTSNSENITSVENTQAEAVEIGAGYSLHINKKKQIVQIHSGNLSKNTNPKLSLVNFENKRKMALDSLQKENYVEFSTDNLSPGMYLLRISIAEDNWMELIIEKVKEV